METTRRIHQEKQASEQLLNLWLLTPIPTEYFNTDREKRGRGGRETGE